MKIAFDVGGVLSKYPEFFRNIIEVLKDKCEIYCISDMPSKELILQNLSLNSIEILPENVYSADYNKYGEMCKAVLCKELGIDCLIDDFASYLVPDSSVGYAPVRLLVQPDPNLPYFADEWKTEKEYGFGRNKYKRFDDENS